MEFDVFVEIPRGTRNKYEMDHESGRLRLDRMLVIAPSAEAQQPNTIGGTFLIETTPSQKQERLILVEFNPDFCSHLKRRFPRATIVQGDAYDVHEALAEELKLPVRRWGGNATTRYFAYFPESCGVRSG